MTWPHRLTRYRTVVVDGYEGTRRDDFVADLAPIGFLVRRMPTTPHHLDPARPCRELRTACAQQHGAEAADVAAAYARVFVTLAQYVPVVTLDVGGPAHPIRAHPAQEYQL